MCYSSCVIYSLERAFPAMEKILSTVIHTGKYSQLVKGSHLVVKENYVLPKFESFVSTIVCNLYDDHKCNTIVLISWHISLATQSAFAFVRRRWKMISLGIYQVFLQLWRNQKKVGKRILLNWMEHFWLCRRMPRSLHGFFPSNYISFLYFLKFLIVCRMCPAVSYFVFSTPPPPQPPQPQPQLPPQLPPRPPGFCFMMFSIFICTRKYSLCI